MVNTKSYMHMAAPDQRATMDLSPRPTVRPSSRNGSAGLFGLHSPARPSLAAYRHAVRRRGLAVAQSGGQFLAGMCCEILGKTVGESRGSPRGGLKAARWSDGGCRRRQRKSEVQRRRELVVVAESR
jgi:hypothetical protein